MSTYLQLFLLLNAFLMGVLTTIAVRHAYAHFRPHPAEIEKPHIAEPPKGAHLPPEVRERMLQQSQTQFQTVLDHSAEELQQDLKATSEQMSKQLEKLGSEVADAETKRYHTMLEDLHQQAEASISGAKEEISSSQDQLKTKLAEQMAVEQERLVKQIDTKLADAVVSFLIETMQHNVDLGAQTPYLTSMLEEHKADFKREVADEAPAAK